MAGLVVITRPIEDAQDYADELKVAGFQTFVEPMLAIEPVDFEVPCEARYDGVLMTSANAADAYQRNGGSLGLDIPVYCVGKYTADAAREIGFEDVISVDGTGADLLAHVLAIPDVGEKRFLHICGRHLAFPLGDKLFDEGVQADSLVVYDAVQVGDFSDEFLQLLRDGEVDAVTFFSKRTAEAFVESVRETDSESLFSDIKSLSISTPVLECVRVFPWCASYASQTPDRAGMLKLLKTYVSGRDQNKGEKNMSKQGIQNAQDVIEAFGGIRPMAKKIDVAVTTVQGWKKRNVIPATRLKQILSAAQEHDINLGDLIDGANVANENVSERESAPVTSVPQVNADDAVAEDEGDVLPEAVVVPVRDAKVKTPAEKISDSYDPKPTSGNKVLGVVIVIIALGLIAVAAYFWQQSNAEKAEAARVQLLEEKLAAEQLATEDNKDGRGFLGNIIPKNLGEQIINLQNQAKEVQENIANTAQTAQEAAQLAQEKMKVVSEEVLAKDAGTLEERLVKLETHIQDITGKPVLAGMLERVQTLQATPEGNDVLARTVAELDALFGGLQLNQPGADLSANGDQVINSTLDGARTQSDVLGATFSSVPQQDLKAAAMLLGMAQLRSSLNRDNAAFEGDLALLKKLVGEDNVELNATLDRLAPHAAEGILTPGGLSSELRTFAGEAVAASLSGEDVSVKERAKARMNELFQVEKDGELITGTDTQASLLQADKMLQGGDIAGAISAVQGLDGNAATALAPWLEKASGALDAQKAKGMVSELIDGSVLGGKYINNEETGINVYVPNRTVTPKTAQ